MNLTESDKKRLTEFLGEYFCHPDNCNKNCERYTVRIPPLCTNPIIFRTFTTPQDMMDMKDRLVEKGMWDQFIWEALRDGNDFAEFANRIMNPATFIPLVAEYLEGQDAR